VALPPEAAKSCWVAARSTSHGAASWLICARTPLTSTFPCLLLAPGFAATLIWRLPAPCPAAGVDVIQLASDDAFQVHSGWVLTATVVVAPLELIAAVGAVSVMPHFAGDGPVDVATVDPQPAETQARHHAMT